MLLHKAALTDKRCWVRWKKDGRMDVCGPSLVLSSRAAARCCFICRRLRPFASIGPMNADQRISTRGEMCPSLQLPSLPCLFSPHCFIYYRVSCLNFIIALSLLFVIMMILIVVVNLLLLLVAISLVLFY